MDNLAELLNRRGFAHCYHNDVSNSGENSASAPSGFGQIETVFLDRDGVVNEKMPEGRYVTRCDEFHLLPRVPEAIALLNRAGLRVIVVSNQRGVALGLYSADDVRSIHSELQKALQPHGAHVDAFYFCPHDKAQCNCRKPLPGMFEQAQLEFPETNATTSLMIGDSHSDMEFAHRLGMKTVFIDGPQEKPRSGAEAARQLADFVYCSLYEAVENLLARLGNHDRTKSSMCLGFPENPR